MLDSEIKNITPNFELHIINIEKMDSTLKNTIDQFLITICEGIESTSDLNFIKLRLKDFLSKKNDKILSGAVAELLIHVYLNSKEYKQDFLYLNLEEGSIKKGFDGYFSKDDESYIIESKSGSIKTQSIHHQSKLKEAYLDLSNYITGKSKKGNNNPWMNAYNHACHSDVATKKEIKTKLKQLATLYQQGLFGKITDFNIIPSSTIFLDDNWDQDIIKKIAGKDEDYNLLNFEGKKVIAICINNKSLKKVIEYIQG